MVKGSGQGWLRRKERSHIVLLAQCRRHGAKFCCWLRCDGREKRLGQGRRTWTSEAVPEHRSLQRHLWETCREIPRHFSVQQEINQRSEQASDPKRSHEAVDERGGDHIEARELGSRVCRLAVSHPEVNNSARSVLWHLRRQRRVRKYIQ